MKISDKIRESKASPDDEKLKNDFNDILRKWNPRLIKQVTAAEKVFDNFLREMDKLDIATSFPKTPVGSQVKAAESELFDMLTYLQDAYMTLKKGTLFVK